MADAKLIEQLIRDLSDLRRYIYINVDRKIIYSKLKGFS